MATTHKTTIISQRKVTRDYGLSGMEAIVELQDGKLVYIRDGLGGDPALQGRGVRWEHGLVGPALPGEGLDTLSEKYGRYGKGTPYEWSGMVIAKIAEAAGL